jgi:3-methyl-2-oxobutanoate hydroxymethyltransferase
MRPLDSEKRTVRTIKKMKKKGEKISALTAYEFPTAQILSEAGIDIILVGDSLGMVLQGRANTLKVTLDEVIYHTRLVARAEPLSLLVSDMPFGAFHIGVEKSVENAIRCVKEGGAEAVKIEGGRKRFKVIEAIINAEVPVMGHLGLTPQSVHAFGGFKVQGKLEGQARQMVEDAAELEKLGVFALVLESIPMELAKEITDRLHIPTIGIGAGKYCDGQILVFHDLMGFSTGYLPKFVRRYADLHAVIHEAVQQYIEDIREGEFPGDQESYHWGKDKQEPADEKDRDS